MNIVPVQFPVPHGWAELKKAYGDFTFTEMSGGNVSAASGWMHDNLVTLHDVAHTGQSIQLHRKVAPIFEACLEEAIRRVPGYAVRMLGGYCARHMQHDPKMPLSIHSWGAAFDINWDKNPMGHTLITDIPVPFREAFTEQGWNWGGGWNSIKDAMHFQYAVGM